MAAPDAHVDRRLHDEHAHDGHGHDEHGHDEHTHDRAPQDRPSITTPQARAAAVRKARWLNVATIVWNSIEGVVAVVAGMAAGSVSLIGFGIDSAIEVSAALILTWRLRQERHAGCRQDDDARATKLIALCFAALALYVAIDATGDLRGGVEPEASVVGVGLAALSLVSMPLLAREKASLAPVLGSAAAAADAKQTNLCALLSAIVLLGVGANTVAGLWWADPVAGLGIAVLAGIEAVRTWRAESLDDTCCA